MPYTITREDAARDLKALRAAIEKFRYPDEDEAAQLQHVQELADSIEEQVKPIPPEPKGDVVVLDAMANAWIFDDESEMWLNDSPVGSSRTWQRLVEEFPDDKPKVYRFEGELGNPAEWARLDAANADNDARATGHDHVSLEKVLQTLDAVGDSSITATEKETVQRCARALIVLPTYARCETRALS